MLRFDIVIEQFRFSYKNLIRQTCLSDITLFGECMALTPLKRKNENTTTVFFDQRNRTADFSFRLEKKEGALNEYV